MASQINLLNLRSVSCFFVWNYLDKKQCLCTDKDSWAKILKNGAPSLSNPNSTQLLFSSLPFTFSDETSSPALSQSPGIFLILEWCFQNPLCLALKNDLNAILVDSVRTGMIPVRLSTRSSLWGDWQFNWHPILCFHISLIVSKFLVIYSLLLGKY